MCVIGHIFVKEISGSSRWSKLSSPAGMADFPITTVSSRYELCRTFKPVTLMPLCATMNKLTHPSPWCRLPYIAFTE